jgi:tRNA threonylcarbamoyladenosine biosynthesis protein TsaB
MNTGRTLLALETSGKSGSVAVATSCSDGSLSIEQEVLDPEWGSARTLAPAIAKLLERLQLTPHCLHAISVVQGPGSFTGLRVGAATAKTMAWALGIPLIAVDALDGIAHQVAESIALSEFDEPVTLVAVSDAYRGQFFRASYRWNASGFAPEEPTGIEDIESLVERFFRTQERRLVLAGPGLGKLLKWSQNQGVVLSHRSVQILQGPESVPMASTVADLGWRRWKRGAIEDVLGFLPRYYRGSAAEEKKKGNGLS